MLFQTCGVIYTVKELDSHAKHGQRKKKRFGPITEYFCAKYTLQVKSSFIVILLHVGTYSGTKRRASQDHGATKMQT